MRRTCTPSLCAPRSARQFAAAVALLTAAVAAQQRSFVADYLDGKADVPMRQVVAADDALAQSLHAVRDRRRGADEQRLRRAIAVLDALGPRSTEAMPVLLALLQEELEVRTKLDACRAIGTIVLWVDDDQGKAHVRELRQHLVSQGRPEAVVATPEVIERHWLVSRAVFRQRRVDIIHDTLLEDWLDNEKRCYATEAAIDVCRHRGRTAAGLRDALTRQLESPNPPMWVNGPELDLRRAAAEAIVAVSGTPREALVAHRWFAEHGTVEEAVSSLAELRALGAEAKPATAALARIVTSGKDTTVRRDAITTLAAIGQGAADAAPALHRLAAGKGAEAVLAKAALRAIEGDR